MKAFFAASILSTVALCAPATGRAENNNPDAYCQTDQGLHELKAGDHCPGVYVTKLALNTWYESVCKGVLMVDFVGRINIIFSCYSSLGRIQRSHVCAENRPDVHISHSGPHKGAGTGGGSSIKALCAIRK